MSDHGFPWKIFFGLARDLPAGRPSLERDTRAMLQSLSQPPEFHGLEHMPASGPALLVANHYQRRGLWIGWAGALITQAVATRRTDDPPVRMLVTGGLRLLQPWNRGPEILPLRPIFRRVATGYGMTPLPVIERRERARAIRSWLDGLRAGQVLVLFPEGLAGNTAGLVAPEAGFDGICRLVARGGSPILPAGIHYGDGRFHLTIGPPVRDAQLSHVTRPGEVVMCHLASCLPAELRGNYTMPGAS